MRALSGVGLREAGEGATAESVEGLYALAGGHVLIVEVGVREAAGVVDSAALEACLRWHRGRVLHRGYRAATWADGAMRGVRRL